MRFKGAFVAPKTGPGGGEEGDIAGAADPHGLVALVPDLVIPDEPLHDLGHDAGFFLPHQIGIEPAPVVFVVIVDRDFEAGDGMAIGRRCADRHQGRKARLSSRL